MEIKCISCNLHETAAYFHYYMCVHECAQNLFLNLGPTYCLATSTITSDYGLLLPSATFASRSDPNYSWPFQFIWAISSIFLFTCRIGPHTVNCFPSTLYSAAFSGLPDGSEPTSVICLTISLLQELAESKMLAPWSLCGLM